MKLDDLTPVQFWMLVNVSEKGTMNQDLYKAKSDFCESMYDELHAGTFDQDMEKLQNQINYLIQEKFLISELEDDDIDPDEIQMHNFNLQLSIKGEVFLRDVLINPLKKINNSTIQKQIVSCAKSDLEHKFLQDLYELSKTDSLRNTLKNTCSTILEMPIKPAFDLLVSVTNIIFAANIQ